MHIVVKRTGALGDVVLTTPIIRRLKRENPHAVVSVQTAYPDVFRNSPRVDMTAASDMGVSRIVDLDGAYEKRPLMHIVYACMEEAFGYQGETGDLQQELFFERRALFSGRRRKYVAVHAAHAGWRNRTLPSQTWIDVCAGLKKADLWPILVGTGRDALPTAACTSFHSSDVLAQAQLIDNCACFVGSDTGLLHVAGATSTPIVGVFTSVDPAYRMPLRDGDAVVTPKGLDCLFCHGRRTPPVMDESCEREGDEVAMCVRAVRADAIVDAVLAVIAKKNTQAC